MAEMIVREFAGHKIRHRADGFLSATDMCQSHGKTFGHWHSLKSTKEYLDVLTKGHYRDHDNGPIESNVGGSPENTGTWVDRRVAMRLAQWLSPQFAIQVDEWVVELMTVGKVSIAPEPPKPRPVTDPNLVSNTIAISTMLTDLMVDGEILDRATAKKFVLNQVALRHPELSSEIKALNAAAPIEVQEHHYTPTQLGAMLEPSKTAREINLLLTARGLQSERNKEEPHYVPTEKGKPFAKVSIDQQMHESGKSKTFYQLKWAVGVLDVLQVAA